MGTKIEKELREAYRKSKEYLDSMSALELMENSGLFMKDLQKLVDSQRLPAAVLAGCLMQEVYRLSASTDNVLLDSMISKSFRLFKRYVDENFMRKE